MRWTWTKRATWWGTNGPTATTCHRPMASRAYDMEPRAGDGHAMRSRGGSDLADILERVLDKGVVIAGDIAVNLLDIELLTIKLRLLVASVDTARAMGLDWWTADPFLTAK